MIPGMALSQRGARSGRSAPRRATADPTRAPFSGFLERDEARLKRRRHRNRIIALSVGLHVVVLALLIVYSFLNVDELFGPSVEVKIFAPGKLPEGVTPVRLVPAPPPPPPTNR
jgi:hypothetical protein